MISSGDSYATKIYAEYNQAAMTAFPTLSNGDIDDILAYTAAPPPAPVAAAAATTHRKPPVLLQGVSNEINFRGFSFDSCLADNDVNPC